MRTRPNVGDKVTETRTGRTGVVASVSPFGLTTVKQDSGQEFSECYQELEFTPEPAAEVVPPVVRPGGFSAATEEKASSFSAGDTIRNKDGRTGVVISTDLRGCTGIPYSNVRLPNGEETYFYIQDSELVALKAKFAEGDFVVITQATLTQAVGDRGVVEQSDTDFLIANDLVVVHFGEEAFCRSVRTKLLKLAPGLFRAGDEVHIIATVAEDQDPLSTNVGLVIGTEYPFYFSEGLLVRESQESSHAEAAA